MLSKVRFNTDTNNLIQLKELFECADKHYKICLLYVNEGNNFIVFNNMRWELCLHVICRDINAIYYLKCNMCDHKETYIGKTDVVGFKSRISQYISDCRTGISTCKFPIHIYHCAMTNKCLKEPFFQLFTMMKLKDSRQLEFYKNYFHKKGYDTLNCPEYVKNTYM